MNPEEKDDWQRRQIEKARQYRKREVERWAARSPEEKRHLIKVFEQRKKAAEALKQGPPRKGMGWLAPEWFSDIPIPVALNPALQADQDVTDELIARIERDRALFADWIRQHGTDALDQEENRLTQRLQAVEDQIKGKCSPRP